MDRYLKFTKLLSEAELSNDCTVSFDIDLLEIVKKASSLANHLEKAAARMMVLVVASEVLCEVVDSACENSDLNFGRTCVTFVTSEFCDDFCLFCLKHSFYHLLRVYRFI